MNLQIVADEVLVQQSRELADKERKVTVALLLRINEVYRRDLHLKLGFGSLMDWLVKDLKYSHGAAGRRIAAAKLLNDVPVAAEKILDGSINLSTLCQVQTTIRSEEKRTQVKVSVEQKKELLERIDSKSQRETEIELARVFPQAVKVQERVSVLAEDHVRVTVTLTKAQLAKLERVKELNSHAKRDATLAETIEILADVYLQKKDPLRKPITPGAAAADLNAEVCSPSSRTTETGSAAVKVALNPKSKVQSANVAPYSQSSRVAACTYSHWSSVTDSALPLTVKVPVPQPDIE